MGATGKSVETFLKRNAVVMQCCDDLLDYPQCDAGLLSQPGYVFKSPGLKPQLYHALPEDVQVINDVELLLRMTFKPVILVTGTNGKSTVVALLETIFNENDLNSIACGNNGVPVLDAYLQRPDVYIIELSSYQLENLSSQCAYSSVVLNVGIDHVDRYRDMNEYAGVKQGIHRNSSAVVVPVNESGEVSYGLDIAGYQVDETVYRATTGGVYKNDDFLCHANDIALIGQHNYLNICASLALVDKCGFSTDRIKSVLMSFQGLEHRMEPVCTDQQGRVWINDSKSTNVHSTAAAMSSMCEPVVLIMGGQGKGEDYSQLLKDCANNIQQLVLFGKDAELINGQAQSIENRHVVDTVADAVELAAKNDAKVLFSPACASFDQYRNYIERGNDFKNQVRGLGLC